MDKEKQLSFQVLAEADPADIDFVRNGLRHYNSLFADNSYQPLHIFLRDNDGTLVGGLLGDTYWGWLAVNILWLDEGVRRQGYGERLLAAAEDEARRRGCAHVHLDTLSFQARPFYEKLGYRVYGALEDFPAGSGHTRYYMTKDIQTGEQ